MFYIVLTHCAMNTQCSHGNRVAQSHIPHFINRGQGFLFPSWPGLLISFLARASYFLPGPGFLFPSWPGFLFPSYFLPGPGFLFPSWPRLLISFLARASYFLPGPASYFLPGPGFLFPSWSGLLISFLARASYFLPGPGFLFPSWPFSTRPLNEAGLYMKPTSIYAHSSRSGFLRVLFCAVYSSKLESDFVALSLGQNGDQCSYENRI